MAEVSRPKPQPIHRTSGLKPQSRRRSVISRVIVAMIVLFVAIAASLAICLISQLTPFSQTNQYKKITIASGSTSSQIGELLESKKIIRSSTAFRVYLLLTNQSNKLQAGTYRLSPADSTPDVIKHLISGTVDKFKITFYPNITL